MPVVRMGDKDATRPVQVSSVISPENRDIGAVAEHNGFHS